jgi:hypothetical protein
MADESKMRMFFLSLNPVGPDPRLYDANLTHPVLEPMPAEKPLVKVMNNWQFLLWYLTITDI